MTSRRSWHTALHLLLGASAFVPAFAEAQLPPPPASPRTATSFEYDAEGNLTKVITGSGADASSVSFGHDAYGNPKTVTDALGRAVASDVGVDGATRKITDARKLETTYDVDAFGNALTTRSPDTGTSTQTFDVQGRVATRTDAAGVTASIKYDALGRFKEVVYKSPSGSVLEAYTGVYDETAPSGSASVGRLTSTTFPSGWSRSTYDALGRVASVSQAITASAQPDVAAPTLPPFRRTSTMSFGYDVGSGLVNRIVYPSGRVLTIEYSAGKPTALRVAKDAVSAPVPVATNITWDAFGPPSGWTMGRNVGGNVLMRDLDGRLVRYSGPAGSITDRDGRAVLTQAGGFVDLTYDAAGKLRSERYVFADSPTGTTYGYDALHRLASVTRTAPWSRGTAATLEYDDSGNLIVDLAGNRLRYAANSNRLDRIEHKQTAPSWGDTGTWEYTFTATGALSQIVRPTATLANPKNPTQHGGLQLTYGATGALSDATSLGFDTVRAHYGYDSRGLRVFKTVGMGPPCSLEQAPCPVPAPTSATSFVYDDAGHLLGEYDMITGAAVAEYVWLGDLPVAVLLPQGHVDVENEWWTWIDTSSSASPSDFSLGFLQADQLNTPRSMVGEDGFVIWQLDSGGDGSGGSGQIANTNLVPFNLRFSNQYFDQETGLHYNWHRTYDPKTRRYIQSDPVGLSAGPNTYAYVDNAPFDAVDPSGFNPTVLRLTLKLGYETGSALYPVVAPYIARAVDAVLLDPITAHALDPSEVGEDDRGRSGDDAWANVERQVTHDYYKRRCGQQPDDETKKDKCLSAWFFFERDIDCEDLMRAWDAKNKSWLAAKNLLNKHAEAIQNAINGQNNELSRIDRYCGNRKKPKKPQACP